MPLEATPGASNANSFITVARGDELASERAHSTAWTGLTPDVKAAVAITASRALSSRVCYEGVATVEGQALAFPRTGLTRHGYTVDPDTIPQEIELAAFEWALALAPEDVTVESQIAALGLTKLKAGSVELGFRERKTYDYKPVPENVLRLIPSEWVCVDATKPRILFEMI